MNNRADRPINPENPLLNLSPEARKWVQDHSPTGSFLLATFVALRAAHEAFTLKPRLLNEPGSVRQVRAWLAKHPDQAFSAKELIGNCLLSTVSVREALARLVRVGDAEQASMKATGARPAICYQITPQGIARPTFDVQEKEAWEKRRRMDALESYKSGAEYQLKEQERFTAAREAFFTCPWNTPAYVDSLIAATHPNDLERTGEVFDFYDAEVANEEADRVSTELCIQGLEVENDALNDAHHKRPSKPLGHLAQIALSALEALNAAAERH